MNVGKCKGIDSKLSNRQSDEDQRFQLYSKKLQNKFRIGARSYKYIYRLLKTEFRLGVISFLFIETWHAT